MIVRVMGEGQYQLDDAEMTGLNELDDALVKAIDTDDPAAFSSALRELCGAVTSTATRLPDDSLETSDYVLPSPDASLEEVKALLGEEGLLPG